MVPARRLNPLPSWYASASELPLPEGAHRAPSRPRTHFSLSPCPSSTPVPADCRRGPAPGRRETRGSTFSFG